MILMRRIAQISSGKILGSAAFVAEMLGLFADRVRSRSARARAVDGIGFASHGWRLAAMLDAAAWARAIGIGGFAMQGSKMVRKGDCPRMAVDTQG